MLLNYKFKMAFFSAGTDDALEHLQSSQEHFFQVALPDTASLSDSHKDFLRFEHQRAKTLDDAKSLRLEQLQSENDQLKVIVAEMRREIEQIRDRSSAAGFGA